MKKKGFIATVLATVMVLGSLTGCGAEKVTAESLLSNTFGTKEVKSLDVNVVFDLNMDSTSDATTNFAINLDCDMQSTKEVAYTDGKATIELLGAKTGVDIKSYADIKNKTAYTYIKDSDSWAKSALDSSFSNLPDNLGIELLNKITLDKRKSENADYVVNGKISYKDIKDFIGEELKSLSDSTNIGSLNLDKLSFNVKMDFDKNSKLLKFIVYSVDTKSFKPDDYTINKFEITTTIKGINKNNDLSIPEDVDYVRDKFDIATTESHSGVDTSEGSSKNLAQIYLSKDSVSKEDIESILVNYYSNIKNLSPDAMNSLLVFFNNYTADDFANRLDAYDSWSDNDKVALAILYDIGVVDDETLSTFSISSVDIQSYVSNYVTPLR